MYPSLVKIRTVISKIRRRRKEEKPQR